MLVECFSNKKEWIDQCYDLLHATPGRIYIIQRINTWRKFVGLVTHDVCMLGFGIYFRLSNWWYEADYVWSVLSILRGLKS